MATILIIEDDESIRFSLSSGLAREGFQVLTASNGEKGLDMVAEHCPALILLDLMLPDISGLDVCRLIRKESDVPIIMVTARDAETDIIAGLEMGANDYVTKPFSMSVLMARVRAALRRGLPPGGGARTGRIRAGSLILDPVSYGARAGDRTLDLTPRLFQLLLHLASSPGQVASRDALLDQVWDYDYVGETRTLDVHVHWLRQKLEPLAPDIVIETVRGVGYRLVVRP